METLDISVFDSADTADMTVAHPATSEPTNWVITFAGPGHPKTIDLADRRARQHLREEKAKEQARVNGRKWKGDEKTPAEQRAENIEWMNWNADVRPTTRRSGTFASAVVISSVIPSEKNS